MALAGDVAAGIAYLSSIVGLALFVFAANTWRRVRDPRLWFLAGAFGVFALKSFTVGYSLANATLAHETLEVVDVTGDLLTVGLLAIPIVWKPS